MAFFDRNAAAETDAPAPVDRLTPPETPEEKENVLKLKKPLMVNGDELRELEYDFDALTANDLHKISKDLKTKGIPVTMIALDYEFQISTFARAVQKVNPDVILNDVLRLSAHDAMRAAALARDFLLAADPESRELGSDE